MNGASSTDPLPAQPEVRPSDASAIESAPATPQDRHGGVRLVPDMPPGRCTRKALAFTDEIHRLYAAGYTLAAIRRALSAAGVTVSRSTVHREVSRARKRPPTRSSAGATPCALNLATPAPVVEAAPIPNAGDTASPGPSQPSGNPGQSSFAHGPRGEDVAKAFMSTQITNPFMRKKEQR